MEANLHTTLKKAQKHISEDKIFKAITLIKNFPLVGKAYKIELIALENRLNMLYTRHQGNLMYEDAFLVNKAKICHSLLHLIHRIEAHHSISRDHKVKRKNPYYFMIVFILSGLILGYGFWRYQRADEKFDCYEKYYLNGEFKKAYDCYEAITSIRTLSPSENAQKENCRSILLGDKYFLQMLWVNAELSYKGVKDKNLEKYFIHRLYHIFELQKKSLVHEGPNKNTRLLLKN